MDPFGIGFLVTFVLAFGSIVLLWIKAFQKSVVWGLGSVFIPFVMLVFVIMQWSKTWKPFVLYLVCSTVAGNLFFRSPTLVAAVTKKSPHFADMAKRVDPGTYAEAQKINNPPPPPGAKPTPREVRDLAENETPFPDSKPAADPNAAQRAAYTKHARELAALYQQLNAERAKLKPGTPAMTAFNAKAAKYQQGLQAATEEKTRLDALDHAANLNVDAVGALAAMQAAAASGDYETFAATSKKALAEYRATPSFAGIVALARATLPQATPDKIAAGMQAKAARTARADFDKTTRQVQGIVNQVPPAVPKPTGGGDVYGNSYHPGANPPDYNATNLIATREGYKGEYTYMENAPGVYYRSADCEFNPATKFFYTNRSAPKKKLSDAEYAELTRLYHLLGQQEKAVADATPPDGAAERVSADLAALKAQLDGYAMK